MMKIAMLEPVERTPSLNERLSSPELIKLIERFVRRRVPQMEVDDLVQTVLVHALASERAPDGDEELRKWLVGITRHKVADFHRKGGRVKHVELSEHLEGAEGSPHSAREWVDWAEKHTGDNPEAKRTLDWMAREGAGEKLAHIAEDAKVNPTQVRQRVSRMRRFMKQQWAAELAAVAAIVILAIVAWRLLREPEPVANPVVPDVIPFVVPTPEPQLSPEMKRAQRLRQEAEAACDREAYGECRDKLNEAAGLDPDGAKAPKIVTLRERAERALAPPPDPTDMPEKAPPPDSSTPDSSTPAPAPVPNLKSDPVKSDPVKSEPVKPQPTPTTAPPPAKKKSKKPSSEPFLGPKSSFPSGSGSM